MLKVPANGSCQDNWIFLDSFIREWCNPHYERNTDEIQISEFEKKLNLKLPQSLKDWIAFYEASESIEDVFSFRDIFKMEKLEEFGVLAFLLQGEDDVYWTVKYEHLNLDDPPVTVFYFDYDTDKFAEEGIWAEKVSYFAFDYLISYMHTLGFGLLRSDKCNEDFLELTMGKPQVHGHIKLWQAEGLIAYTSTSEVSWGLDYFNFKFKEKSVFGNLHPSLKEFCQSIYDS